MQFGKVDEESLAAGVFSRCKPTPICLCGLRPWKRLEWTWYEGAKQMRSMRMFMAGMNSSSHAKTVAQVKPWLGKTKA